MKSKLLFTVSLLVFIIFIVYGFNFKDKAGNDQTGMDLSIKQRVSKLENQVEKLNQTVLSLSQKLEFKRTVPSGTIIAYAGNNVMDMVKHGWLLCNGDPLNSELEENRDLYAAIGRLYGGDGKPFFNLPDYEGYFLRGYTENQKKDPGITERYKTISGKEISNSEIGSLQKEGFLSHDHGLNQPVSHDDFGDHGDRIIVDNMNSGNQKLKNTEVRGGKETRPRNVYVYFLIKR